MEAGHDLHRRLAARYEHARLLGLAQENDMSDLKMRWRVRYTELHGRRYGLRDVATTDPDGLLCEGSGGARWWTETVCTFPGNVDDEKHARLIAAAPELLAALQPFAALLDTECNGYESSSDDVVVRSVGTLGRDYAVITVGDLRRACAAIAKATGEKE